MNRIVKNGMRIIVVLLPLFVSLCSFGQSRIEKSIAIINKLKLVEAQKSNYQFQLDPLKYQATGNDSLKLIEIEKQLSEEEIIKRITSAFNEIFNDVEINDIYNFIQTSAFEKFFNTGETYKAISNQFKDIDKEIKSMPDNFKETIEIPTNKFEPIPVDKEDGFYATIDYYSGIIDKEIKLENNPSLTTKDILEVKKVFNRNNDRPEISIVFTKQGARKFYLLTKENIGKPIAIVIAKQIVSLPIVNGEIMGGKANISGDFSDEEIDKMIEKLKEK